MDRRDEAGTVASSSAPATDAQASLVRKALVFSASFARSRSNAGEVEAALRAVESKLEEEKEELDDSQSAHPLAGKARVELNDGDVYRGPWLDHSPVGYGRYSWANGNEYVGEFHDGKPSGRGTYEWTHGGVYKGNFEHGLMHGEGTYMASDGAKYHGSWRRGKKHGLGIQHFTNGDRYEGLWNDGVGHGPGTYRWKALEGEEGHDEFDGEWVNGKMHGWGTLRWASGDRYDGNWSAGQISGNGVMTWCDGSSFSGRWKCGKKDGSGAFMLSGGENSSLTRNSIKLSVQINRSARLKTSFDDSEGEEIIAADLGNTYLLLCECSEDQILKKEVVEVDGVTQKYTLWKSPMASRSRKVRKVRHGETIYKGHGSYDLMLQLRVGIRWSVSSMQEFSDVALQTRSFDLSLKQQFPRGGSAKTPPHFARAFKWKEYRPEVFRQLRARWRVDPAQFMLSLCGDQALRELSSPGKSGSVFYISHDDQFIIKTMRKSEMARLKSWLHVYYQHVHDYPETLLPKFYGLYSIKAAGTARKVRVVVMSNLFSAKHPIHKTFDLKGSTHGRFTKLETAAPHTVLKDLDISRKFRVEEGKRDKLIDQMKKDCMFLQKLRIMDYSLLVGVHVLPPALGRGRPTSPRHSEVGATSPVQEESGSPWGGAEWRDHAMQSVRRNMKALDLYNDRKQFGFAHGMEEVSASELASMRPPPGTDDLIAHSTGAAKSELGVAMAAVSVHGPILTKQPPVESPIEEHTEPQDVILYLGIIDILQEYTTSKNLETKMMGVMGKKSFSSIDPKSYAIRFLNFMSNLFE